MRHISFIPKFFHIDFPDELADQLLKCESNLQVKEVGIEWSIRQAKELMKNNVPSMHFYTMGKSAAVKQIAKAVY